MRIDSIQLRNYRCHADLRVDFRPGFNVIVGVNGSGKTSLLNALCVGLTGFAGDSLLFRSLSDPNVVRLAAEVAHGRYRFEPQYPVQISMSAAVLDTPCDWKVQKSNPISGEVITGLPPGRVWRSALEEAVEGQSVAHASALLTLPVTAFYRANRHWNQSDPNEMQAATAGHARNDGYGNWWDAALDSAALQEWVIGKCLERFQTSSETGVLFDDIQADELELVNQALAAVVEGAKGLKYDFKQKILLMEWVDDTGARREPTAFENLSDGQRAVIALVADIARRMCLLNPQLGQEVTVATPGVVLIDELDMHLHPHWQRLVTHALPRAFPKVQFIVASHSPQVLGELQPEQIILLRPEGTAHPRVSYGLTSSQVLEEIMGAEARSPDIQTRLAQLFEHLERLELAEVEAELTALEKDAPDIPELTAARALLRRKQALGR